MVGRPFESFCRWVCGGKTRHRKKRRRKCAPPRDTLGEMCFLCSMKIPKVPEIPEIARTALVVQLLEIIAALKETVQGLRDELAEAKGQKKKPKIKPSRLAKGRGGEGGKGKKGSRGCGRRSKGELEIHRTEVVKADNVPAGSRFKGYEDFTVHGLIIKAHNVRYRRERWLTPDGGKILAPLPEDVAVLKGHCDAVLKSFTIYQHYHAHVTQPLILEQLREFGVNISAGQINKILIEGKESFHREKDELLRVGLEVSRYIQVDDTGARHQGRNGYCTHIGNELFAWFKTTFHKTRINFLELLRAGDTDYVLNAEAIEYIRANKLPKVALERLPCDRQSLTDKEQWDEAMKAWGITKARHIQIVTEGALVGAIVEHGISPGLVILSDDAGQFNVLLHALCWIHAERLIAKLVGFSEPQRKAREQVQGQIWELYQDLKAYRVDPTPAQKTAIEARFDEIFTARTCYVSLDNALKRLHRNKAELLLVLERPEIPLHNNLSEGDIREFVKKRKVSGGTRSDAGRQCRDTFASLKKTCRKLGISFWQYVLDRISGAGSIAYLPALVRQRALLDSS